VNPYIKVKRAYNFFKKCRDKNIPVLTALYIVLLKSVYFLMHRNFLTSYLVQINDLGIDNSDYLIKQQLQDDQIKKHDDRNNSNIIDIDINNHLFIWSVPNCLNIWGGGHYTIFRFINYFATAHNVKNIIYIYNYDKTLNNLENLQNELNQTFKSNNFILTDNFDSLPCCSAAIATTWQSAYSVKKMVAKQKFYFMQDYESLFYPAGTNSLQANYTYTFGFHGITGGYWLKQIFESYGFPAEAYIFSADRDIFYPLNKQTLIRDKVKRIFFYGRPSTERRAYELGISGLGLVAKKFPEIEIIIAGLSGIQIPKETKYKTLGSLSLRATGDLYRTCDIGLAFSATNMSYLPVELMASGCPVISNNGPQVEWFCKDGYNALLIPPMPSSILQAVTTLVDSYDTREKLAINGLQTINKTTWDMEMEKIYQYINKKI